MIGQYLRKAGYPNTLEPVGLSTLDGKRPDGVTLTPWTRGLNLTWDFTTVDIFAPSNSSPDLLVSAENRKSTKYSSLTDTIFIPVVATTIGNLGTQGLSFLKQIGKAISRVSSDPKESFFIRQKITMEIVKSNTISIHGSMPTV